MIKQNFKDFGSTFTNNSFVKLLTIYLCSFTGKDIRRSGPGRCSTGSTSR